MNSRLFAIIALTTVQIIYGLTFTFANVIIDEGLIKPFGFILIRVTGATVLFWLLSTITKQEKIENKDFKTLIIASFFGVAFNMLTFFKGLEYTTPIHASSIMITTPIIVLLLSAVLLKEHIKLLKILGVTLGFAGAIILSVYGRSNQLSDNVMLGNFLVFVNAVSYSVYLIIIKKLTNKYHPFTFMKWLFVFGFLMVLPFGYEEFIGVKWSAFQVSHFGILGFVVFATTFLAYLLNPLALRVLKASTVSSFIFLQPLIAGVSSVLMGSDVIDAVKIVAASFIFIGVFLVTKKQTSN